MFSVTTVEGAFFSNNANVILAACVVVLAGVAVFLFRKWDAAIKDKENIQDQRLAEAKELREKQGDASTKQTELTEKIYELLISGKRGR